MCFVYSLTEGGKRPAAFVTAREAMGKLWFVVGH